MVTFHNQRDFIFIRHHRYIYRQEEDTNLANQQVRADIKRGVSSKKSSKNEEAAARKDKSGGEGKIAIKTRARLQELGPRFTLKLKYLQEGLLNTEFGEYEWVMGHRKQMQTTKRKFVL